MESRGFFYHVNNGVITGMILGLCASGMLAAISGNECGTLDLLAGAFAVGFVRSVWMKWL